MRRWNRVVTALSVLGVVAALAGCATADEGAEATTAPTQVEQHAPINVLAAASLAEAFDEIIDEFEAAHPEFSVAPLVTGGSQELVQQILGGAPADVVALASEPSSQPLIDAGVETEFSIFAENTIVIAVQPGNPLGISSLADLADPSVKVAMCAPEVPCGAATQKILEAAGVTITGATEENNVPATLAKAELREVDAALVYRSDVHTSDAGLEAITPEGAENAVNRYPISTLSDAPGAAEFVAFVQSDAGRAALERAGLIVP